MSLFRFKQFDVIQANNAMKVGTDAMVLGALVNHSDPKHILDIGAGTGVIALMMAQKFPEGQIHAVEIDALAATECALNFENSKWTNRMSVHTGDFLEFQPQFKFDLIVSNPPYFQSRLENEDKRKAVARHESALPVALMMHRVSQLLQDNGMLWVIVPFETESTWLEVAQEYGLFANSRIAIYGKENAGIKRWVICFSKVSVATIETTLTIRNTSGNYTDQYIDLTSDFHFSNLRNS